MSEDAEESQLPVGAKPIDGYPDYAVDGFGVVYSRKWRRWRRLKGEPNNKGYLRVSLCANGRRKRAFVHRLVAVAFLGVPPFRGAEARHLDDDHANNFYQNLAWGTRSDNMQDMVRNGHHVSQLHPELMPRGDRHGSKTKPESVTRGENSGAAIITENHVRAIRALHELGFTLSDTARVLGIPRGTVKGVANQNNWAHVDKEAS
jgi:hypothetical protein